jgi:predicted NBD/HSP70 family sugar kinase
MPESAIGVDLGGTKALLVSGPHSLRFDTGPSFSVGAAMAARRGVAPAKLAELALACEPEALAVIEAGGSASGMALAAVVNLLNPSRLALGGGAADLPGYRDAAERAARQHSITALWNDCTMVRVAAGERVVALGALRAGLAQSPHQAAST